MRKIHNPPRSERNVSRVASDMHNFSDADLAVVQPLIVPADYGRYNNFPAPLIPLAEPSLALTWVALTRPDWMVYVTPSVAAGWEARGVDLYDRAMANMREADAGRTWTHEQADERDRLVWVAMMQDDGLGSSRLLCREELESVFPMGYEVALPDRSCGMALSNSATAVQRSEFLAMVQRCFEGATIPMLGEILSSAALAPRSA